MRLHRTAFSHSSLRARSIPLFFGYNFISQTDDVARVRFPPPDCLRPCENRPNLNRLFSIFVPSTSSSILTFYVLHRKSEWRCSVLMSMICGVRWAMLEAVKITAINAINFAPNIYIDTFDRRQNSAAIENLWHFQLFVADKSIIIFSSFLWAICTWPRHLLKY